MSGSAEVPLAAWSAAWADWRRVGSAGRVLEPREDSAVAGSVAKLAIVLLSGAVGEEETKFRILLAILLVQPRSLGVALPS